MIEEIWADVPDFPGYQASDLGRIRTFRSPNGRGAFKESSRIVKQDKAKGKKYYRVCLSIDGVRRYISVHIIILLAFCGQRPSATHDGCHSDGNHENNTLDNLYWGTKKENANDRILHGTQCRGERVGLSKLSDADVKEIIAKLPTWKKGDGRKFAKKFGVGDSAISAIKNKQTWKHL